MDDSPVNSTSTKFTKGQPGPVGYKNHLQHGLYTLRSMLKGDTLDKRTSLYRALAEKERELVVALGGEDNVSPQERIIIGDTVKHMLFMASIDSYLLSLKSLIRKGRLRAVVPERTRIGAHIRENLRTLGLKRVSKELSLSDYIEQKYGDGKEDQDGG
jgi:hypothetical protein